MLPPTSTYRFAYLCRAPPGGSIETHSLPTLIRSYPRYFTLITRTAVLTPATLAALPSTRAIPIATYSMSLIPSAPFIIPSR